MILQQPRELLDRKPSLSNQRPKRPLGKFLVIWNREPSMWRVIAAKDYVAAVLLIKVVSGFPECLDCVAAGNNR